MNLTEIIGPVAVIALIAFAAVLAIAETSLTHLGRGRAAAMEDEGERRAPALLRLLEHRERVLNPMLLALAGVAADDAVIDAGERELIVNTIEFGDTIVREVMVPRPDMVTVSSDFRVGDAMEVAILNGLSRLPVQGEGIDDIIGVLHAKDLMRAERDGHADGDVHAYLRPAFFVPETKKVAELLREMQARRTHLAVVVDEYGGTAGLATLEDLLEELVGEIVDEYDVEETPWERLPSGELRVNGRLNIDDLSEVLDADLPDGDWDSVGGMLIGLLGHVPEEGEAVEVDGHRFTAERVQDRRIQRVIVSPVDR